MIKNTKVLKRDRLHKKIRSTISGTGDKPRLCVFRSNKYIYAQLVDDVRAVTLAQASDISLADKLPKLNIEKLDGIYLPELVNRFFDVPSLAKRIDKLLLDIPTAIIQILFGLILLTF